MEYIEKGLDNLVELILKYKWKSLAIPALGCGLGGLDYYSVHKLIYKKLRNTDSDIIIYVLNNKIY